MYDPYMDLIWPMCYQYIPIYGCPGIDGLGVHSESIPLHAVAPVFQLHRLFSRLHTTNLVTV